MLITRTGWAARRTKIRGLFVGFAAAAMLASLVRGLLAADVATVWDDRPRVPAAIWQPSWLADAAFDRPVRALWARLFARRIGSAGGDGGRRGHWRDRDRRLVVGTVSC
jgi:hypothetical protein